jgi:UDPglucose 6-dehydrogenase
MQIGIIGMGCIGTANQIGFESIGHSVIGHDPKLNSTIEDIRNTEIAFVCVPTPSLDDGGCDSSIIDSVLEKLSEMNYNGIIAIRSTVIPGYTQAQIDRYTNLTICFVPEFLRERCAVNDFIKDQKLLSVGTNDRYVYQQVVQAFGDLPAHTVHMTPNEAEILKYFNNSYAALRVTFANIMYELCKKFEADYTVVKNAYIGTGKAGDMYLDVSPHLRGYGGRCLPKDIKALSLLIKEQNLPFNLIEAINHDNDQVETTIFNGMRK